MHRKVFSGIKRIVSALKEATAKQEARKLPRNPPVEKLLLTVSQFNPRLVRHGGFFLLSFPRQLLRGPKRTEFLIEPQQGNYESLIELRATALLRAFERIPGQKKTVRLVKQAKIASASLLFERNAVIIAAIKGEPSARIIQKDQTSKQLLDRLTTVAKMPWANYLVQQVEQHARQCGFREVRIAKPETLHYYREPYGAKNPGDVERIRKNMRTLYYNVAKAMGYTEKGDYFVKQL